jgi:hypothetical protein
MRERLGHVKEAVGDRHDVQQPNRGWRAPGFRPVASGGRSMIERRLREVMAFVGLVCGLVSCSEAPPDEICRLEGAQETGLRVLSNTDAYFYADDREGTQVGYERANGVLALEPGTYRARLNDSHHAVTIRSGGVTVCTAGELLLTGSTDEYYYVLDTAGTQLAYERLGRAISLFPGSYVAKLNDVTAPVTVVPGDTSEFVSGTLVVTGTTEEYYYVLDPAGAQLAYNRLGRPLSFLPGDFTVRLNKSTSAVRVAAGRETMVRSGDVTAVGTTDDYFYVLDTAGTQLGYERLGRHTAYLPGSYRVRVTNQEVPLDVVADELTEVQTGTLHVGPGDADYYYVLDEAGRQLGYNKLDTPTPLPAGTYDVKIGDDVQRVTIMAGETTTVTP